MEINNDIVSKSDMMFFRNEILGDLKKIDSKINSKIDEKNTEITDRMSIYDQKITILITQISEIYNTIANQKNQDDKISQFAHFKQKTEESMFVYDSRIHTLEKDINNAIYKYDNIISNSILVPGLIGNSCRFPTVRAFLDYSNKTFKDLLSFKDKNTVDLKSYKNKLENLIQQFNLQIENIQTKFAEYVNKRFIELENKLNDRIKITDDRIDVLRLENGKYANELVENTNHIKIEWNKLEEFENNINEKIKDEVLKFQELNENTVKKFNENQNDFKIIKQKFTRLSEFIKDVRFRKNLGQNVPLKAFKEIGKQIDFSKKQKVDDDSLSKNDYSAELNMNNNNDLYSLNLDDEDYKMNSPMSHRLSVRKKDLNILKKINEGNKSINKKKRNSMFSVIGVGKKNKRSEDNIILNLISVEPNNNSISKNESDKNENKSSKVESNISKSESKKEIVEYTNKNNISKNEKRKEKIDDTSPIENKKEIIDDTSPIENKKEIIENNIKNIEDNKNKTTKEIIIKNNKNENLNDKESIKADNKSKKTNKKDIIKINNLSKNSSKRELTEVNISKYQTPKREVDKNKDLPGLSIPKNKGNSPGMKLTTNGTNVNSRNKLNLSSKTEREMNSPNESKPLFEVRNFQTNNNTISDSSLITILPINKNKNNNNYNSHNRSNSNNNINNINNYNINSNYNIQKFSSLSPITIPLNKKYMEENDKKLNEINNKIDTTVYQLYALEESTNKKFEDILEQIKVIIENMGKVQKKKKVVSSVFGNNDSLSIGKNNNFLMTAVSINKKNSVIPKKKLNIRFAKDDDNDVPIRELKRKRIKSFRNLRIFNDTEGSLLSSDNSRKLLKTIEPFLIKKFTDK